jgi:hypothetical protein
LSERQRQVIDAALADSRAVFLTRADAGLLAAYDYREQGALMRVLRKK